MTDLIERLEALAGKVTLDNCVTARTAAKAEIRTLCTNNLPTIIAALKVAELVRDEDWLVDQIRDYFPAEELAVGEHIAAAREIIAAMGEEVK